MFHSCLKFAWLTASPLKTFSLIFSILIRNELIPAACKTDTILKLYVGDRHIIHPSDGK